MTEEQTTQVINWDINKQAIAEVALVNRINDPLVQLGYH